VNELDESFVWLMAWTLLLGGAMIGTTMVVMGLFNELPAIIRSTQHGMFPTRSAFLTAQSPVRQGGGVPRPVKDKRVA
jgi:hypothetical protein